jgi:molecular chaperone DnaK (HSP70)
MLLAYGDVFDLDIRFVASAGHMSTVFIRLFQGERSIAQDNQLLTQLELAVSLPPAPGGRFPIEVTLDVDMDEIRFTVTDLQRSVLGRGPYTAFSRRPQAVPPTRP